MADVARMIALEFDRSGTPFRLEVTTGTAAVASDTKWADMDAAALPTEGMTTSVTLVTEHRGRIFPALSNPELVTAAAGLIADDDHILLCAPDLDFSQSDTRKVAVIWPLQPAAETKHWKARDLDFWMEEGKQVYRRAILSLREGRGTPGA